MSDAMSPEEIEHLIEQMRAATVTKATRVRIPMPTTAIPAFAWVHEVPSNVPAMCSRLEVIGFPGWGVEIRWLDMMGTRVFWAQLLAADAPDNAFPSFDDKQLDDNA